MWAPENALNQLQPATYLFLVGFMNNKKNEFVYQSNQTNHQTIVRRKIHQKRNLKRERKTGIVFI